MPENDLVSTRRGNLDKAEEERMRVATWKLAALMGAVPTIGCVQKIVPPEDRPLGDSGVGDMDANVEPPDGGNVDRQDAGDTDAGDAGGGEPIGGNNCTTYCTEILATCEGAFRQYESLEQCLNMCADMPLGLENDKSGDSVACRIWHTRAGVMQGAVEVHCRHAGPTGGTVCGSYCESLCDRVTKVCVEANGAQSAAYESKEACLTTCQQDENGQGGYAVDRDVELPATGDTVNCRIFHLANVYKYVAGSAANEQQVNAHCEHTRQFSSLCN
jgi:hypothetical protein